MPKYANKSEAGAWPRPRRTPLPTLPATPIITTPPAAAASNASNLLPTPSSSSRRSERVQVQRLQHAASNSHPPRADNSATTPTAGFLGFPSANTVTSICGWLIGTTGRTEKTAPEWSVVEVENVAFLGRVTVLL